MMTREGGVTNWSESHNSKLELEYSKLALTDLAHRASTKECTPLHLPSGEARFVRSTM